jgi:PAS domain S-box-containing protein
MKDLSSFGRSRQEFQEKLIYQINENFTSLFNTIDELVFILNENGNIIQTNTLVNDLLGYTNEELSGSPFLNLLPAEFHREAQSIFGEQNKEKRGFYHFSLLTKSSTQIPVSTRTSNGLWNGKPAIFIVNNHISVAIISNDQFSTTFHLNPVACGLLDADDLSLISVNEAFIRLFGFDKDDLISGKTLWDLGITVKEQLVNILKQVDLQRRLNNFEVILTTKYGDVKNILISLESIKVQDKNQRIILFNDITERKSAERMIQDVIDKNPMSMQIIDKNGFTVKVNQAHTLLFGALFPSDYSVFNDPQLIQSGFAELFVKLKKGEIVHFPETYYNTHFVNPQIPDMSIFLKVTGFPINFTNEEPEHFVLMHENITNRRIADEALRKSENLFRSVVHNSSDLIVFTDEKGILRYVSPQCQNVLGYQTNKFIGKTFQDIIHPEDKLMYRHAWEAIINYGQEEHDFIYKIIDDQKKVRWISQNSKLLKDKDVNIGIQSTLRDITEQRQAEEDFTKLKIIKG